VLEHIEGAGQLELFPVGHLARVELHLRLQHPAEAEVCSSPSAKSSLPTTSSAFSRASARNKNPVPQPITHRPHSISAPGGTTPHRSNRQNGAVLAARGFAARHRGVLVAAGLLALTLAVYFPYALKGGWYYDDWRLYSRFHEAGGSWLSQFKACTSFIPGGRSLDCLYHVTEYHFLTDHRKAYQLVSIVFLVAMATMTYAILCRCRLPWYWSAAVAGLLIVFPASDSTRLWPTGAIGQYVMVLELGGVLITLTALKRPWGDWKTRALHLISLLLFVLAMLTYEITVPLVALNGIVYWAAYRDRAAVKRGLVDLGLAFCFLVYRLAISPPKEEEGFTVHRTISENIHRASDLLEAGWHVWREVFIPGAVGTIAVIAVLVLALAASYLDPELRRRLKPWWYLFVGALVVGVAATFVYQTANALYAPEVGSLFNRVVLPAAIPYVCIFVALLGIGAELIVRFVRPRWLAGAAIVAVVAVSCWHQLRISTDHKREYENSWIEQQRALPAYEAAVRNLPEGSRIFNFGTPIWEPEYIPIFAATWDLKGALRYTTGLNAALVTPFLPLMTCGPEGIINEEVPYAAYRVLGQPLYFIDTQNGGTAVRVNSKASCEAELAKWGYPPFTAGEPPA
jgi:hypothetical protein